MLNDILCHSTCLEKRGEVYGPAGAATFLVALKGRNNYFCNRWIHEIRIIDNMSIDLMRLSDTVNCGVMIDKIFNYFKQKFVILILCGPRPSTTGVGNR